MDITVPTVRGVRSGLENYGVGAVGGLVYRLATRFLGNNVIGGALSAALAGSVVKGSKGDAIAVMAGFQTGLDFAGGLAGADSSEPDNVI